MGGRLGSVAIGAVIGAGVLLALWFGERRPDPLRTGEPAPGFSLPRLEDGREVRLEQFRGRVVLLNFWATWCKPCEEEMPAMERLYRELEPLGFTLLAVSVDETPEPVAAFRDRLRLSFPILWDPERRVSERYQTYRYPESFLIAADGTLLARYIGPRDWDAPDYVAHIRGLLEG